jgi:hypothetical protein
VARQRPTASDVAPPDPTPLERAGVHDPLGLTRAQAHSLRRCAPLTPAQFKTRGVAEQEVTPLGRAGPVEE